MTIKTGFLAELIKTDRRRDWRLLGVIKGDIISDELLLRIDGELEGNV